MGHTVRVAAGIHMGRGRATGLLRLLGRRRDACADGPDGLVRDDDPRFIFQRLEDLDEVDELRRQDAEDGADALLACAEVSRRPPGAPSPRNNLHFDRLSHFLV